jgi:hypothetical protein
MVVQLAADSRDSLVPKASQKRTRLIDDELRLVRLVFVDEGSKGNVEHGDRIVPKHALRNRMVSHQILCAGQHVSRETHNRRHVHLPEDVEAMGRRVVRISDDFIPRSMLGNKLSQMSRRERGHGGFIFRAKLCVRPVDIENESCDRVIFHCFMVIEPIGPHIVLMDYAIWRAQIITCSDDALSRPDMFD